MTWGLGGFGSQSHRTVFAILADELAAKPAKSVAEVANKLVDQAWTFYASLLARCHALNAKMPFDPKSSGAIFGARTKAEEEEFEQLKRGLVLGYCVGGYIRPNRAPEAFTIGFDPLSINKPTPAQLPLGWGFWGATNMIQRLMFGV